MNTKPEPIFLSIKAAAYELGLSYRTLLEAVNAGVVPHYKLRNSRMLVLVPEVVAIMKNGGGCNV